MTSVTPETVLVMLQLAAVIGLKLWIAGVLLRERSVAAWLLLAGSVLWAVGIITGQVYLWSFLLDPTGSPYEVPAAASFAAISGMFLFTGGFLIHAWRSEPLERRIAVLEITLEKIGRDRSSGGG